MKSIGIFYGSSTGNTELVADKIQALFGEDKADVHNIDSVTVEDMDKYNYLILGTSSWGTGNLQDDWEEFESSLKKVDFSNKKVAIYGLGDQEVYADSFVDGMGILYKLLSKKAKIFGSWPVKGYRHHRSNAVIDGKFVGLAIDFDNEPKKMEEQIIKWVEQLKKEFK